MIKFFRKVRQNLIIENRVTKYLLYAIGEIVLVVVGILIAIQINNLNEAKKTKALEFKYLIELKEEFTKLEANCTNFYNYNMAKADYSLLLLNLARKDTVVNIHDLHVAIVHPSWVWKGNFSDNIWAELISNGNQALISNEVLKNTISQFHFELNQFKDYQEEFSTYNLNYRNLIHEILTPYLRFNISRSISQDNMYDRSREIPEKLMTRKAIRDALNKNPKILHALMDIHTTVAFNADLLKILISDIQQIIEMIDEEIDPHK